MRRKKQSHPKRSRWKISNCDAQDNISEEANTENIAFLEPTEANGQEGISGSRKPFFVPVESYGNEEHLDIAEVVLKDNRSANGFPDCKFAEDCYNGSKYCFRFHIYNLEEHSFRLGHWPIISANEIFLELVALDFIDRMTLDVSFSANFDGPDDGITGLVHLVSQKLLTLRLVSDYRISESSVSCRMRVEMLPSAFDACGSLLESTRQPWKKSMLNVMAWLRPEVTTEDAKYGVHKIGEFDNLPGKLVNIGSRKHARFDAVGFYEALRPSKEDPMLQEKIPELVVNLRPYQRRAAYWMVQREKETVTVSAESLQDCFNAPFCVPVNFLDENSKMFYNPFSGNVSLQPEFLSFVSGGILADEMGLGKTVELLACIFSHRRPVAENGLIFDPNVTSVNSRSNMKRLKRERIDCICGAVIESRKYKGLWVQCDICDAWQHAECVGFSPRKETLDSRKALHGAGYNEDTESLKSSKKKVSTTISKMDGDYICTSCSELMQKSKLITTTGATLIVCPSAILPQWHDEIIRHTRPGSAKLCIYEGVKNVSTATMDLSELTGADIVLTTYEVLKEDLSHDSDRIDGDSRCLRFQKRYPIVPTLLTRVLWWRICLDEAQMVESNTTAATEMAMRLQSRHRWCITGTPIQRQFDDLFGLLRFLGTNPFNVHRWWIEIIRDPYQRNEMGAIDFTHKFFKKIMWRSSKVHVSDELQLPPQEERVTWLTFSPIEAHFYQRQHECCEKFAQEVIGKIKDGIKGNEMAGSDALHVPFLAHCEAAKLLHSLLKLRQACCHPQVGSSGLRSLQQSPMTMEEILDVLVGKAKTEGEEALRKLIVALNGLAGIAVLEQDFSRAVLLYEEALALAEENSEDFRLDPLLNLHIHHNLAELLPFITKDSQAMELLPSQNVSVNKQLSEGSELDRHLSKKRRMSMGDNIDINAGSGHLGRYDKLDSFSSKTMTNVAGGDEGVEHAFQCQVSPRLFNVADLKKSCENIKQKYLSVFISKLSVAQEEFKNSYLQVCEASTKYKDQHQTWWLDVLNLIEKDKDASNELIRRIEEGVAGSMSNSKSKISSRFRSLIGLKYHVQTGLDSLESSRQILVDQLLKVDESMENPRDEDIERVRYCPKCQANAEGSLCVHCELDELFLAYEARLFHLKRGDNGGVISSAEEALGMQKKKSALNRFFGTLSQPNRTSTSTVDNGGGRRQRDTTGNVVITRSASELEIILRAIRSYARTFLRRETASSASKHLLLFEAMRKEYCQARCLSIAQAQILRAHDEIKMATSRLRLRDAKSDASSIDALCLEELIVANGEFTNEKFLSLSLLSRIKGQLRYLKGLVKEKVDLQKENNLSVTQDSSNSDGFMNHKRVPGKVDDEPCPICHENLSNQKMVFQCGHITCCKCFLEMMEQLSYHQGKFQKKWLPCPTCRQCTDAENVAYVDDKQNRDFFNEPQNEFLGTHKSEISIHVKGSYGTKIEAITRRILFIKSSDPKAKVLVFSSWNDVLDVLEHAFEVNNITYIRMKGGRKSNAAIVQFKGCKTEAGMGRLKGQELEQDSIQVLLLLIQHGANGLNILEAQHVIFTEPLLNPAAEAQAVNRVHRIGQDKKTFVHRFVVKNTVEESIYKLNRGRSAFLGISGNTKDQEKLALTLKDVESLFSLMVPASLPETCKEKMGSLNHLHPSVAAALAAERRLQDNST